MATTEEIAADIRERIGFSLDFVRSELDRAPKLEGLREQLSDHAALCAAIFVSGDVSGETADAFADVDAEQIEDFAERRFVLAYPNEFTKEWAKRDVSEAVWQELGGDEYPVAEDDWSDLGGIMDGDALPPLKGLNAYIRPRQEGKDAG